MCVWMQTQALEPLQHRTRTGRDAATSEARLILVPLSIASSSPVSFQLLLLGCGWGCDISELSTTNMKISLLPQICGYMWLSSVKKVQGGE